MTFSEASLIIIQIHLCIWIAGDLNLPNINWDTSYISSSVYPSDLCDTVIDFVEEYGFTQTVNFATRGNNILDIFFYKQTIFSRAGGSNLVMVRQSCQESQAHKLL